jgi:hypothetical protein
VLPGAIVQALSGCSVPLLPPLLLPLLPPLLLPLFPPLLLMLLPPLRVAIVVMADMISASVRHRVSTALKLKIGSDSVIGLVE